MEKHAFLQHIFQTVDKAVAEYAASSAESVATAIGPVANQMLTLYIILWGFAMYRGLIQEPVLDAAFRLIKVALIMNVAISVGTYSSLISNNLLALPEYLASLVGKVQPQGGSAAGPIADSKSTLDLVFSDAVNAGLAVWETANILKNPGAYLIAAVIWLSALVSVGYAAFLIVLAKVMLGILLGIGPIFVICLMFESTKKFFESWLGQALNYVLISALCTSIIKMLFGMFKNSAGEMLKASQEDDMGILSVASFLLMTVVCFLSLAQVQNIASSLAGGISISTMGAVSWATDKLKSAAGSLRPSNIQKAYRGVKRDVRAVKAGAQMAAAPAVWAARKVRGNTNSVAKN